jgi:hypothetical protein
VEHTLIRGAGGRLGLTDTKEEAMGRKLLTSAVIAAATFGVAAGPALAKSQGPSLSNGAKLTKTQHSLFMTRLASVAPTAGTALVLNHSKLAECTVPQGGGNYANFFSKDTTNYFEADSGSPNTGILVGNCTADLNNKQTSATAGDKPGAKKLIPFPGSYATYNEACNITYKGTNFIGDAMSMVYSSGEFDETCIVPVSIS